MRQIGLDQYLHAREYVSPYTDRTPFNYIDLIEDSKMGQFIDPNVAFVEVTYPVGYWRKANAIHNWFVRNVQGGIDDCREVYVEPSKLKELHEVVVDALSAYALDDHKRCLEIMPPRPGFFFGDTEINDNYSHYLQHTIKVLDNVNNLLKIDRIFHFYYQSSW